MGGAQSFPFALVPAEWRQPEEPAIGAEALHLHFRDWLAELGHDSYRDVREPEGAAT
jgi:hypothetical protein